MHPPLAVYIHWPFCKSKCPYCDFNSHVREAVNQDAWRAALLSELEYMARLVPDRTLSSIFFGGGTPSLMPAKTAQALIEKATAFWPAADDVEITLEANPTSVEMSTFADFKQAGVNRVSLGVQSLKADALAFLGREHNVREALTAVDRARTIFARYSFDLIYALPGQTPAGWEEELTEALGYAGSHLSLYQLTIEENTAFYHAYAKGNFVLPSEESAADLYQLTDRIMQAHNLPAYEVSNYARTGQESRHNLTYWQGGDYIGIGPGAHGRLTQATARIATQTLKSPERWLEGVGRQGHGLEIWQPLETKQVLEERLMMGLRLVSGIEAEPFLHHINPHKHELYVKQGLLADDTAMLRPTLKGRLVLNRLTAELLGE